MATTISPSGTSASEISSRSSTAEQQIEGPLEDVEVEIELGDRGHGPTLEGGPAGGAGW